MSRLKGWFGEIVDRVPLAASWRRARRMRQRQRDWTARTEARFGNTSIAFFTNIGIGDLMIVRQVLEAFTDYCNEHGDPKLGRIVISAGVWYVEFPLPRGDVNLYWWWSMNGRDSWLDDYLAGVNVKPDAICCLSDQTAAMAESRGVRAIKLPLAAGRRFAPLYFPRKGVGFGGSRGHKDVEQVEAIVRPFEGRADFEWVDNLKSPDDLCRFYNCKQIVLGMTERFQEKTGMVNNRVFEVLATDTPFIIHRHHNLSATLGFEYPYQSSSAEETLRLAEAMLNDYDRCQQVFRDFGSRVRSEHTWSRRIGTLLEFLSRGGVGGVS